MTVLVFLTRTCFCTLHDGIFQQRQHHGRDAGRPYLSTWRHHESQKYPEKPAGRRVGRVQLQPARLRRRRRGRYQIRRQRQRRRQGFEIERRRPAHQIPVQSLRHGLVSAGQENHDGRHPASQGPRRVNLVMMRELTSEEFGNAFMAGLNANSDQAERTKVLPQTMKFGEMFAQISALKKGDVLTMDWLPGEGTQCMLNGKKIGDMVPDVAFYNAILRIWIGDKPVDSSLKPALLGA